MGKRHRKTRKKRTHEKREAEQEATAGLAERVPQCLVFRKGPLSQLATQLVTDTRSVFLPHTARRLQTRSHNHWRDFVNVAGMLSISHLVAFSATDWATYMRVVRVPRGPTLTFRVSAFSTSHDVRHAQKRPHALDIATDPHFKQPPLLIMNGFSDRSKPTTDLMAVTFQSMFPAVNVRKAHLNYRRVLLLSRQELEGGDEVIYVRHYMVRGRAPASRSRLKELLKAAGKENGDAARATDDVFAGDDSDDENEDHSDDEDDQGQKKDEESAEESDEEDGDESDDERTGALGRVLRNLSRNVPSATQLRLVELGPRMELQLVKVEQGVCEGKVLFHKYIHKSKAEEKEQEQMIQKRKREKEARKQHQEHNVQKKTALKEQRKRSRKPDTEE